MSIDPPRLDPDQERGAVIADLLQATVELQRVREGLLAAMDVGKSSQERQQAAWGAEAWARKLTDTAGVLGARGLLVRRIAQREEDG